MFEHMWICDAFIAHSTFNLMRNYLFPEIVAILLQLLLGEKGALFFLQEQNYF